MYKSKSTYQLIMAYYKRNDLYTRGIGSHVICHIIDYIISKD